MSSNNNNNGINTGSAAANNPTSTINKQQQSRPSNAQPIPQQTTTTVKTSWAALAGKKPKGTVGNTTPSPVVSPPSIAAAPANGSNTTGNKKTNGSPLRGEATTTAVAAATTSAPSVAVPIKPAWGNPQQSRAVVAPPAPVVHAAPSAPVANPVAQQSQSLPNYISPDGTSSSSVASKVPAAAVLVNPADPAKGIPQSPGPRSRVVAAPVITNNDPTTEIKQDPASTFSAKVAPVNTSAPTVSGAAAKQQEQAQKSTNATDGPGGAPSDGPPPFSSNGNPNKGPTSTPAAKTDALPTNQPTTVSSGQQQQHPPMERNQSLTRRHSHQQQQSSSHQQQQPPYHSQQHHMQNSQPHRLSWNPQQGGGGGPPQQNAGMNPNNYGVPPPGTSMNPNYPPQMGGGPMPPYHMHHQGPPHHHMGGPHPHHPHAAMQGPFYGHQHGMPPPHMMAGHHYGGPPPQGTPAMTPQMMQAQQWAAAQQQQQAVQQGGVGPQGQRGSYTGPPGGPGGQAMMSGPYPGGRGPGGGPGPTAPSSSLAAAAHGRYNPPAVGGPPHHGGVGVPGAGGMSGSAPVYTPRTKKPLAITDKHGNPINLGGSKRGSATATTASSTTSVASSKDPNDGAATSSKDEKASSTGEKDGEKSGSEEGATNKGGAAGSSLAQAVSQAAAAEDAGLKLRAAAEAAIKSDRKAKEEAERKRKEKEAALAEEERRKKEEEEERLRKQKEEEEAERKRKEEEERAAAELQKRKEEEARLAEIRAKEAEAQRLKEEAEEAARKKAVATGGLTSLKAKLEAKREAAAAAAASSGGDGAAAAGTSSSVAVGGSSANTPLMSAPSPSLRPGGGGGGGLRPGGARPGSSGLRPGSTRSTSPVPPTTGLRPGSSRGASTMLASAPPMGGPVSATSRDQQGGVSDAPVAFNVLPRNVYSKDDVMSFRDCEYSNTRPPDLIKQNIVAQPQGGGGGGDRRGGGGGGGSQRGGNQWSRGAQQQGEARGGGRRQSQGDNMGGGGGDQWARGKAPPPPPPDRGGRGGGRGGPGGRGGRGGRGYHDQSPVFDGPVKPLERSKNRWRPSKDDSVFKVTEKKVFSILNKMTKTNYSKLSQQISDIPVPSYEVLNMIICRIYEKAIDEPNFGDMYADLCVRMSKNVSPDTFLHIIECREGGNDENMQYCWSSNVNTNDGEIFGPFGSTEECIEVANMDEEDAPEPKQRGEMELELVKLLIDDSTFIKIMKNKANEEEFYVVFFPEDAAEEVGQSLSKKFDSLQDCQKNAKKMNSFKRALLNKCEDEFKKQDIYATWKKEKKDYESKKSSLTEAERREKEGDFEIARIKIKKQMLGNIRFIGELYKSGLIKENVMHECIRSLMKLTTSEVSGELVPDEDEDDMDEEDHEALCQLFTTIGEKIDHINNRMEMKSYFDRIMWLSNNTKQLSSRSRFMYKDLIELRQNKWTARRKVETAKTIDEIRKEAARELREEEQQLAMRDQQDRRNSSNRRDGAVRSTTGGLGSSRSALPTMSESRRQVQQQRKPVVQADGFVQVGKSGKSGAGAASTGGRGISAGASSRGGAAAKESSSGEPLSPDKLKLRIENIRSEFISDPRNEEELFLSVGELSATPDYQKQIALINLEKAIDTKEDERQGIIRMLIVLATRNKMNDEHFKWALGEILEFLDDIKVDVPRVYDYVGDILAALLQSNAIGLGTVCHGANQIPDNSSKVQVVEHILKSMSKKFGSDEVRKCFGGAGAEQEMTNLLGGEWGKIKNF